MTLAFWLGRGRVTCATATAAQLKIKIKAKTETELRFRELMGFLLVMGLGGNNSTERQFDIASIPPTCPIIRPASAILFRSPQSGGHRMSRRITISFVLFFSFLVTSPKIGAQNGHGGQTRLLRTPTVSSTQIGFAYANNIWVAPR